MKLKNLIHVLIISIITLSIASCESFFEDDNSDPNAPSDITLSAALPGIELAIIDSYGGLWSNFGNMFIQQVEGVERQWESFNSYDIQPVRFNEPWRQIYEKVFVELRVANQKANDGGHNHYLGVLKVLEAQTLMMTTDVFGDIPYTEAGLGDENPNPTYDDQNSVIMPAVLALLTDALVLFEGPSGDVTPGSEDVIYGGDIDLWELAAHGLLARYYLRMDDNRSALAEAKMSFTGRSQNMGFAYPGGGNDAPWSGFNDVRQGDFEFHPTMGEIMTDLNDTIRLKVMNPTFDSDHPYLTSDQQVDIISYREIQFIIAETSSNEEQHTAYLAAIKASFEELGLEESEYISYVSQDDIDPGQGNLSMEQIMTQKYIGLFVQPEAFSDWRRTGVPDLTAVTGSSIPRRWFYPENEYLFNESAPERDDELLFQRVDWDN